MGILFCLFLSKPKLYCLFWGQIVARSGAVMGGLYPNTSTFKLDDIVVNNAYWPDATIGGRCQ